MKPERRVKLETLPKLEPRGKNSFFDVSIPKEDGDRAEKCNHLVSVPHPKKLNDFEIDRLFAKGDLFFIAALTSRLCNATEGAMI